eukprot:UN25259
MIWSTMSYSPEIRMKQLQENGLYGQEILIQIELKPGTQLRRTQNNPLILEHTTVGPNGINKNVSVIDPRTGQFVTITQKIPLWKIQLAKMGLEAHANHFERNGMTDMKLWPALTDELLILLFGFTLGSILRWRLVFPHVKKDGKAQERKPSGTGQKINPLLVNPNKKKDQPKKRLKRK